MAQERCKQAAHMGIWAVKSPSFCKMLAMPEQTVRAKCFPARLVNSLTQPGSSLMCAGATASSAPFAGGDAPTALYNAADAADAAAAAPTAFDNAADAADAPAAAPFFGGIGGHRHGQKP